MIKLIKISGIEPVADYLFQKINDRLLQKQRVLWLVAGGSTMDIATKTAKRLSNRDDTSLITVTLTDERYGQVGFNDSNWKQLEDRGFLIPGAKMQPVLNGAGFQETAVNYAASLNRDLEESDFVIALAGMGTDGHIFGIKPNSPAVRSTDDVVAYEWDDFKRITPTISFIRKIDEVMVYAAGREKNEQFDLLKSDIPATKQPVQLLKQLTNVTIFNEYMEGRL